MSGWGDLGPLARSHFSFLVSDGVAVTCPLSLDADDYGAQNHGCKKL